MSSEDVTRFAQQKGFFFRAADSYPNAPAGFWDYGPLGVSVRNKFVELWRRMLVKRDGMLEIDGTQILPKPVFEASGHIQGFTDPFVQCAKCGSVYRPDKLIEEKTGKQTPEKLGDAEYDQMLAAERIRCAKCGAPLSGTRRFNMMFKVNVGAVQEEAYLRPETCQSIFVDFPLLFKTQRIKLPVGLAQVGKSFRNEIAPRQSMVRERELNQAEVEVFFNPARVDLPKFASKAGAALNLVTPAGESLTVAVGEAMAKGLVPNGLVGYYLALMQDLYTAAGVRAEDIRFRMLSDEDKAFYARNAYDLEVRTPGGWRELVACNYRGDYDLGRHSEVSGTDFRVDDQGEKVLPHVFELSMGVDRSIYTLVEGALKTEGERRTLAIKPYLAPRTVGVFPLVNKDGLPELAAKLFTALLDRTEAFYDDSGSIGRRYARADEVGVPYCVTVDYDTLKDQTVTIRERDSRGQSRVKADELVERIVGLTGFPPVAG